MLEQTTAFTPSSPRLSPTKYDLVIVGAGILGLSHAWHALRLGLRTAIVERNEFAVGASVRNFGHVGISMQSGEARRYAEVARNEWLAIGAKTGIDVGEVGTTVVLRNDFEAAVMAEFAATQHTEVQLLSAEHTSKVLDIDASLVQGGAHLPGDLRLDPTTAIAALAEHLQLQGVDFYTDTHVGAVAPGTVSTSRGVLTAEHIVVTVNHDIDRFFPSIAETYEIQRCRLRMLEIEPPRGVRISPAILTGLSLLRYDAFRELDSHDPLRTHFEETSPELLEHDLNHMLTQRPDGTLVVGDTHHRERTEYPFELERSDELLLSETARLFGVDGLKVRRRWRGIYASSADTNFVCETPLPGVRAASVTTGIGMTTALGFAEESLSTLLESSSRFLLETSPR
ncbi:MAG: TIGR03364 family FAD-dependent oxidoreductase [Leucobacter sp.]